MSYCRWSSENWECDLYCYESDRGFTTHVASNRLVGKVPRVEFPKAEASDAEWKAWERDYRQQREWLRTAERKPIGLPYDGQTFDDPDRESFLRRLLELRAVGYRFPDWVLEDVRSELAESSPTSPPTPDRE